MSIEKFQRMIGAPGLLKFKDAYITSTQVLALFTTPITIIAAAPSGYMHIVEGAVIHKPAGTAYTIGTAGNLRISYTNAAGQAIGELAHSGFSDQTTAQTRWINAFRAVSGASDITPVAAAAIVAHILTANMTTGDSAFNLRTFYRTVPSVI